MATNKPCGDGHRQGAVKDRTQVYNPTSNLWVKRGPDGKFMDVNTSGGKFKYCCPIKLLSKFSCY